MSFDGVLLTKLKSELDILKTGRISKINESGDTDFLFTVRANRENHTIMASFSSDFSRIHLTKKTYDTVLNPKSFTMFLRKHIEGYFIEDIRIHNCDRIIYFVLKGYSEMQDLNTKYLICEIMGRYSNLILCNEDYIILDALKHDGVGEFNRTILPNAKYEFPENNKLNPFDYSLDEIKEIAKDFNTPKDFMNRFNGVSLNLAYPLFINGDPVNNFYQFIHNDIKPVVFTNFKNKTDFYYYPLEGNIIKEYDTLSNLLDDYFYDADLRAKVKLKTNDLANFINRQIKKLETKLSKLESELISTDDANIYKLKGELLLSVPNLKDKKSSITVYDYYNDKNIDIALDQKITILENSNQLFKKYQKIKSSIPYIKEQMTICKNELDYFNVLKYQVNDATINEALEIQDELINQKYMFTKDTTKRKLKVKPLTYILENGTLISVGKNNIQNEFITHKLAKSNEMWFHIKDGAGSHVVVHNEGELNEEEIRTGAILAAYYSTYKLSSSVAVDYTRVRNIKKIPGKRNCFVTYKNQHTIYIDPDNEFISRLKVKK